MSKEYYKKKIIDLRAALDKEKEAKKKDNAHYSDMIKKASTPSSKAYKVDKTAYHDNKIESLKRQIENAKEMLKREKK